VNRDLLKPVTFAAFALSSTSIGTLLIYFSGRMGMARAVWMFLVPSVVLLPLVAWWAAKAGRDDLLRRLGAGLWAGGFATLVYDLVRVPIAHSGVPVFKAISYFGTVILGVSHPTLASETVGWAYHLSNGVGFALMYMLLVKTPRAVTAVLWGVGLEVAMLLTPYAEVFGYKRSPAFVAASLGAHVFYGLGLWLAARRHLARAAATGRLVHWGLGLLPPLLIAGIAADFHARHAATIPASPPADIGPDLFVTWSTPEPDRIGAIWLMRRFVNSKVRFHFVEPMSLVSFGTPFDLPEADIRRSQNRSAFDATLARTGHVDDPAMGPLVRMCYMTEIRPWALGGDDESRALAASLGARIGECSDLRDCLEAGVGWFDETYNALAAGAREPSGRP
jgi:hypothetical protein